MPSLTFFVGLATTLLLAIVAYEDLRNRRVHRILYLSLAASSIAYAALTSSMLPLFISTLLLLFLVPFTPFRPADIFIYIGFSGLTQSVLGSALGLGVVIWSNSVKRKMPVGTLLFGFLCLLYLWRWLL